MRVLLVHQNFPGQFKHLAPALVARGDEVVALTMNKSPAIEGVAIHFAAPEIGSASKLPWAAEFETKLLRGEAAFRKCRALRAEGFVPDVIVGHMGWGDTLFLKDVWPEARLGVYCEFFYQSEHDDSSFDPEFAPASDDLAARVRLKLKTLPQRLHFGMANAGITPTNFQRSTYPEPFRDRITVVHDGIDTQVIAPFAAPSVTLDNTWKFTSQDEIITFLARNLEPYRGYHVFMRSLPELLRRRPKAHVFIVGNSGTSYGAPPPSGSWRDIFLSEVKDDLDMARVHFVGHLPHQIMLELLSLSRAHIYLTYPFVLSWSLIEAMAVGAPIVASNTAPVAEVIEHERNGLLVDFFDRDGLVDQVCQLLESENLRQSMGGAARKTAVDGFDLRTVCLPKQIAWVDTLAQQAPCPALFD